MGTSPFASSSISVKQVQMINTLNSHYEAKTQSNGSKMPRTL